MEERWRCQVGGGATRSRMADRKIPPFLGDFLKFAKFPLDKKIEKCIIFILAENAGNIE
jgi:hypothetical protein